MGARSTDRKAEGETRDVWVIPSSLTEDVEWMDFTRAWQDPIAPSIEANVAHLMETAGVIFQAPPKPCSTVMAEPYWQDFFKLNHAGGRGAEAAKSFYSKTTFQPTYRWKIVSYGKKFRKYEGSKEVRKKFWSELLTSGPIVSSVSLNFVWHNEHFPREWELNCPSCGFPAW